MYLAQYPIHTTHTLKFLDDTLTRFHENKAIFVELGVHTDFKLLKLHLFEYYVESIKLFGATNNYNTEQLECLHINFAKDAYRVTNHKDKYAQITTWPERKEKILCLELIIK